MKSGKEEKLVGLGNVYVCICVHLLLFLRVEERQKKNTIEKKYHPGPSFLSITLK